MVQIIKKFFTKEFVFLWGIFLLAYVLRVLPYLLGYNLPFTDDGMRDFDQVLYILENGRINFYDTPFYFGSFPLLHLVTFFIASLGFDALQVFLFVPQIFPSLGLIFFYLFLTKYFPKKESLLAVLLIAIFGLHIHWSAQPVRESLGLFFFPLLIYLFDKVFGEFTSGKASFYFIGLLASFFLMILSHHWSTLMALLTLTGYSLLFIDSKKIRIYALSLLTTFFLAALTYWFFVFKIFYELVGKVIDFSFLVPVFIFFIFLFGVFAEKLKFNLDLWKNKITSAVFFTLIFSGFLIIGSNFSPARYPLQILLPLAIYAFFLGLGFFYTKNKFLNYLFLFNAIYICFFAVAFLYFIKGQTIYSMPFDPFRTIEFAIFPSSIVIAYGLMILKKNLPLVFTPLILLMIFLATLVYPPIFTYGQRFAGSFFYDIRSDVRYVSQDSQELIAWAHNNGLAVYSPRPEVSMYQKVFYKPQERHLTLLSESDIFLKENFDLIKDPIIKVVYLPNWQYDINYESILIRHGGDYLIAPKNNFDLPAEVLDKFIDYRVLDFLNYFDKDKSGLMFAGTVDFSDIKDKKFLDFDAYFISQKFSGNSLKIGEVVEAEFTFKNTGNTVWSVTEGISLRDQLGLYFVDLPHDVYPGEEVTFVYRSLIDQPFATYNLIAQMYKEGFGYFGQPSLEVVISFQP